MSRECDLMFLQNLAQKVREGGLFSMQRERFVKAEVTTGKVTNM